ncbi:response regulator, partial [Rhodoblastus sp.]|uniref:response regulator n=1 Tax=Rhodoblastus sp. TaxID=1962975 RepID=UPI0035B1F48C
MLGFARFEQGASLVRPVAGAVHRENVVFSMMTQRAFLLKRISNMRVLLTEDNERLAALIVEGLTGEGFTLDHCATLAAADDAAKSINYDLILLDLGMPDGEGIDFIKKLRLRRAATAILVITARDGLGDRVKGLDSGADDYLVKPFELPELAARCRALLRRPG